MILKGVTCRVGRTEWDLARIDNADWKMIVGNSTNRKFVGHPAYYRVLPTDCDPGEHAFGNDIDGYFEVWPSPSPAVEVVPHWADRVAQL